MLAALFNKNLKEAYIIERPKKLISKKYIISPEEDIINETLNQDCQKLYVLIWKRTVASQMANAIINIQIVYFKRKFN